MGSRVRWTSPPHLAHVPAKQLVLRLWARSRNMSRRDCCPSHIMAPIPRAQCPSVCPGNVSFFSGQLGLDQRASHSVISGPLCLLTAKPCNTTLHPTPAPDTLQGRFPCHLPAPGGQSFPHSQPALPSSLSPCPSHFPGRKAGSTVD